MAKSLITQGICDPEQHRFRFINGKSKRMIDPQVFFCPVACQPTTKNGVYLTVAAWKTPDVTAPALATVHFNDPIPLSAFWHPELGEVEDVKVALAAAHKKFLVENFRLQIKRTGWRKHQLVMIGKQPGQEFSRDISLVPLRRPVAGPGKYPNLCS